MVKKIKKRRRGAARRTSNTWWVPFDKEGQAAIYIHKHGDTDDHSECGPVVMCCDRAEAPYRKRAPELHQTVDVYRPQGGDHLASWFDSGVAAMYFVLCDEHNAQAGYQFGLPAAEARKLLNAKHTMDNYRTDHTRFTVDLSA